MKKKYKYLNPWDRFKVRKKYRQLILYLISVMSVFLIIAIYLLYISGAYNDASKSLYGFVGMSEFSSNADDYAFSVHFIDVGNGDAILIHTDSTDIMIDCGEYTLRGTSSEYLQHFGIDDIDLFIATHGDSDHIGDFTHIADKYEIGELWFSEYDMKKDEEQTEDEKIFNNTVKDKNIKITSPETGRYTIGDLSVDVLSPNMKYTEDNDNSLVVKITYRDISLLFTGDAGEAAENMLLENNFDISADILKVSHHGSKTATTKEFLDAVSPEYAVISVGTDNKYLPDTHTVERITDRNIRLYRTDVDGSVIIASDGKNIEVFKEKNY